MLFLLLQLGGVVLPNDGKCHMMDGHYAAATKFDYPSLSYLRERMLEAEIVPIFATTGNLELYTVCFFFFVVVSLLHSLTFSSILLTMISVYFFGFESFLSLYHSVQPLGVLTRYFIIPPPVLSYLLS